MASVLRANSRLATAIQPAIIIRKRCDVYPRPFSGPAGPIEFVRADIDQRIRMAVICMFQHNYIFTSRVRARQSQRQFVRLAARVHEKTNLQRLWHQCRQPLSVLQNVFV